MNPKQHFRDLPDRDLTEWRQRPQTALLAESLFSDGKMALEACALASQSGKLHEAAWQSGWWACAYTIAHLITEKHDAQVKEETTVTR